MDLDWRARSISQLLQNTWRQYQQYSPGFDVGVLGPSSPLVREIADHRSASVTTFSYCGRPVMFFLLRPSKWLSVKDDLSNTTGVPPENLNIGIPNNHMNLINVGHELGHMGIQIKDKRFGNGYGAIYYEERHVDHNALQTYRNTGGANEHIQEYIWGRALSGFLDQPPKYWFALDLEKALFKGTPIEGLNGYDDNWRSYQELRARTISKLVGTNLDRVPSTDIVDALISIDTRARFYRDPRLYEFLLKTPEKVNVPELNHHINSGRVFQELERVLTTTQLAPHTRECGKQIMTAAKHLCPTLIQGCLMDYSRINDNSPGMS